MLAHRPGTVIIFVLIVLIIIVFALLYGYRSELTQDDAPPADLCEVGTCEEATVDRVIDGDTVDVAMPLGEIRRVRVLGIDTPETVHPDRPVECLGPEASAAASELLPVGAAVTVVSDAAADQQDTYGRHLAHLVVNGANLGNELLTQGLASTTGFPHSLVEHYAATEEQAQRSSAGIWGRC